MGGTVVMSGTAERTDVRIVPVSSRKERKQFIELPWSLYEGDPNWIPPLVSNQRQLLNFKRHAFYDDAEIQTFLACREHHPVGRIAAIVNHAHNRRYGERRGFFGFFESIDDPAVAEGLFAAAREWFSARNIDLLRGPTNPSLNYECGLLVEGFDTPPFFMMTYNKPYYPRLLEGVGLTKSQDMYAFWGHIDMLWTLDEKLSFIAEQAAQRFNVQIRPMDASRFRAEVELFLDIYNRSLVATWGFVPLSPGEIKHLANGLRRLIIPELALIAEVDGQPAGATFCLLDYNPRIKEIDGRLFPLGFWTLLRDRKQLKRIRIISTNVVPEYQRWGLGLVLLRGLVPKILDWGIQEVEFSWVLESNSLSRGSLEKGGAKITKTYRMYDGDLRG